MSSTFSIGFYNLENLFDPYDSPSTLDKDYTPQGIYKWDESKYTEKIENLSKVISQIGRMRSKAPPVLMGVCEIENESCLEDLVCTEALKEFDYGYTFKKSNDSRGINVALLYQKKHFEVLTQNYHPVDFEVDGKKESSRDIMHVSGNMFGKKIHLIINHWPSRTDGTQTTNFKRMFAAKTVQHIIEEVHIKTSEPNIIIMGDFNDDPTGSSMKGFKALSFENPMESFQSEKKGSVKYKGKWIMFDQILFNKSLKQAKWWHFLEAHIFVNPTLIQKSGRYKGAPKRTFIGTYHQGGYSDHFPVFIYFNTELDC